MKLTSAQKQVLRRIKSLDDPTCIKAKLIVASGSKSVGVYGQFIRDVRTYNLYEALLYVSNYETKGLYSLGTFDDAIAAANAEVEYKERLLSNVVHSFGKDGKCRTYVACEQCGARLQTDVELRRLTCNACQ